MTNANPVIQNLLETNPLREPVLRAAIKALHLPAGSAGLDIGCGIGLQALLLAESVGSQGSVTGLDIDPELLAFGEDLVEKAGCSERIVFRQGDMNHIPFAENTFDWVWSADCVGYPAGALTPLLRELLRVVRPGGSIIILGWSSQQFLPGYPVLEARLNSACSGYLPFLKGKAPELHFQRALHGFYEAGLEQVKVQTFVGDIQAPLGIGERAALTSLFQMLWTEPASEALLDDWKAYQPLCKPGSPDFILDQSGYYAFFTYTMFRGQAARQ